jgi:hypothetical protein
LTRYVTPLCSMVPRSHPETPISQSNNIVDINGVGLKQFWNLKAHMQDASVLATAHYPETLDRIFVRRNIHRLHAQNTNAYCRLSAHPASSPRFGAGSSAGLTPLPSPRSSSSPLRTFTRLFYNTSTTITSQRNMVVDWTLSGVTCQTSSPR